MQSTPIELNFLSPRLANAVAGGSGKYWRWARHLESDAADALLWAIGTLGACFELHRLASGERPVLRLAPRWQDECKEDRLNDAVGVLAWLPLRAGSHAATGTYSWLVSSFSAEQPAFTPQFSNRLALKQPTRWARDIDECSMGILLWNVGEFSCRVPPRWVNTPDNCDYYHLGAAELACMKPAYGALALITRIGWGAKLTTAEAARFLAV